MMIEKPPVQKPRPGQYHVPNISDEQTRRIGEVIVRWSKLEAAIDDTIWMFLGLNLEDGKSVTNRLSTDTKVQLLRILGARHISDRELASNFDKKMKFADEMKDCRNFIAHGVWGTVMPDDIPVALSLKPKSEIGEVISETFPESRMEAISGGIQKLIGYLVALPERLGKPREEPPEQPRT